MNPLGVKKDVYHADDGNEDLGWDAVWEVATRKDAEGWVAEYRIPFSRLRFAGAEDGGDRTWGLQIQRDVARYEERDTWAPWTRQSSGYVSSFGELAGLAGVAAPRQLEVQPYASTRLTRAPGLAENPFFRKSDLATSVGLDLKAGLPLGLTLSATINPDFGQVEVDPAVVNLSAFETFFPEQRPFFVEGSDAFQFGRTRSFNNYGFYQYFYTRRIGRTPQRRLFGSGFRFPDAPRETTIGIAAKVSGKTRGGWSVGLLDAVTMPEEARFIDATGRRGTAEVEPLTNYLVARLRRDFRGGRSAVGGILTATQRDLSDGALSGLLRSHAEFGGMDFEHSTQDRNWVASGFLAGSRISGQLPVIAAAQRSSARYFQRPDADYLDFDPTRANLTGHMGEVALAKAGGGRWLGSLSYREASPGFEMNDLGFHSRGDIRAVSTFARFAIDEPRSWYRRYEVFGYTNQTWNFGGNQIFDAYAVGAGGQLKNFWGIGSTLRHNRRVQSDRLTRGGPLASIPRNTSIDLEVETDTRKSLSAEIEGDYASDELGGAFHSARTSVRFRPSSNVRLRAGPRISVERDAQQYVTTVTDGLAGATFGRRYVFAELRQTTLSMDTRLDWTFTPTLSLQLYAQPFASAGTFSNFKQLRSPGTLQYDRFGREAGTIRREAGEEGASYVVDPDGSGAAESFSFGDPNFNFRSLRGNAVMRWEFRPGSTVYAVWQQSRQGEDTLGTFGVNRELSGIFRTRPTNVFLVKVTYWLSR
ncbi:MAG TPA: DUF5916 domain-containing protein [Gemmatimonadaceae bacterium]|nr:DUF5916 domain-containing protein [Gemmatimonadaceae bacterium]